MDVRCDRCQTEYELDDDSVADGGASVQCTTCGHTFVVGPNGDTIAQIVPTPPGGMSDLTGPQAADWLLATEDGQTHRFRDLTTLQKWVVERKATREDRVSQRGGPWRPLGDVSELAPFFDVVEQADQARSSGPARRSGTRSPAASPATPRQSGLSRAGASRPRSGGVDGDVSGSFSPGLEADQAPGLDGYEMPVDSDESDEDRFQTMAIFRNQRALKIAAVAGFVGLAVVAALIGFSRPRWLSFSKAPEPARVVERAPALAPAPAAPGAPRVAVSPVAAGAPVPAQLPAPAPVVAPIAPAVASPLPPAPVERPVADATAGVKGKSYQRLVADADRLMENGQPARAQKLLDQALLLQPNGVAALSGVAYLFLDRRRTLAAISTFKRALGTSPEFAPALFGLAEAYRAQGELPAAADNYRKYIGVAPGGPDAPAARRQLKDIESLAPRRPALDTTSAPARERESAKGDEPPPAASDQATP